MDTLLVSGGEAVWVDPRTHAQTHPLVGLAPSVGVLNRICVARGFTPFQYLDLLRSLPDLCSVDISIPIVPEVDRYYRDCSLLVDEGKEILRSGLSSLVTVTREHDLAVLLTRTAGDMFTEPHEAATD